MSTLRERWFGSGDRYDYHSMCKMRVPCMNQEVKKVNFYTKDEEIPYFMAMLMGLQHCFAMVGGLITVPYVIFRFSVCFTCYDLQQYAISATLIASGICSLINVSKLPIPFTERLFGRQLYLGSGVLSVLGTSFTFLPIFEIGINQQVEDGVDPQVAFGRMIGTSMLIGLSELVFSVLPITWLKSLFPPLVTSVTVMLIGVGLIGSGMKSWGGGVVCADMIWKQHSQINATALAFIPPNPGPICQNGDSMLGYGSPELIGLGFSVMAFLVFIEVFGSVFMKNCNVILALIFGYMIAFIAKDPDGNDYVDTSIIADAAPITFLWVYTFPLGLYGPAIIPLLIAYLVTTVETVGDISAVFEVSELDVNSPEFATSLQGGLTSDALCSILSCLMTTMPNTTFSQNNGVISLTKCASRRAGYACAFWLITLGVFSKFAGVITSIPDAVLGGMTIFLFANVLTSGISLAASLDLSSRRIKFILALSLAVGVGVSIWPYAFQDMRASNYTANFWRCADCNPTLKGVRNGVSIFLSTGYCVGTVIAMLLNFILPEDTGVIRPTDVETMVEDDIKKDTTVRTKAWDQNETDHGNKVEEGSFDGAAGTEPKMDDEVSL